jgi:hypothetical protein
MIDGLRAYSKTRDLFGISSRYLRAFWEHLDVVGGMRRQGDYGVLR